MSATTANGKRVTTASITMPYYGAWSADIVMPGTDVLDSHVELSVGDLTLVGTVVRQASYAGDLSARVVGGAAGWRNEIPAKGYSHIIGVKLSTLLQDAASECGESVVVDEDRSVGTHWARERASGERALRLLVDGQWWIDDAGVTQTKARPSIRVSTPFTVAERGASRGSFTIGTESVSSWLPGSTFTSATVPDEQVVSSVTIEAGNDGKVRLHVLSTDGATERLRTDIRSIIRAELAAFSYAKVWEYTIAPNPLALGLVSTIDCTPVDSSMPPLTKVPLVGLGVVAAPAAGTSCRIRFVDGDPSQPECIGLGGTTEHLMTTEACVLLIYNVFQTMTLVNPGPWFGLAMQPLLAAAIVTAMAAQSVPAPPGLIAQVAAAAALSSAMTAGTAPSTTIGPLAAGLVALDTKTLDVSGLFPSLGVPNQ